MADCAEGAGVMTPADFTAVFSTLQHRLTLAVLLVMLGVMVCLLVPRWLASRREQRLEDERARLQNIDITPARW